MVTLSGRARTSTDLEVRATACRLEVKADTTLVVRKPGGGGGGDGDFTPSTCTRWIPDLSGETGGSLILVPC